MAKCCPCARARERMLFPGPAAGAGIDPGWILGCPRGWFDALVGCPSISDGGFVGCSSNASTTTRRSLAAVACLLAFGAGNGNDWLASLAPFAQHVGVRSSEQKMNGRKAGPIARAVGSSDLIGERQILITRSETPEKVEWGVRLHPNTPTEHRRPAFRLAHESCEAPRRLLYTYRLGRPEYHIAEAPPPQPE